MFLTNFNLLLLFDILKHLTFVVSIIFSWSSYGKILCSAYKYSTLRFFRFSLKKLLHTVPTLLHVVQLNEQPLFNTEAEFKTYLDGKIKELDDVKNEIIKKFICAIL